MPSYLSESLQLAVYVDGRLDDVSVLPAQWRWSCRNMPFDTRRPRVPGGSHAGLEHPPIGLQSCSVVPCRPGTPSHWTSELQRRAMQAWNTLPLDFRAAPSLAMFQRRLKLSRFNASFPDDRNLISDLSILYSAPVTVLNCDSVTLIISLIIIIIKTTVVAW